MNDDYLEVIYMIIEELCEGLDGEIIDDYKRISSALLNAEKQCEFNEDRPRIKTLLDSLIR